MASGGLTPVPFRKGREHEPRRSAPYVPGKRHPRYWTEADNQVLRDHYPTGGVAACAFRLPAQHSSKAAIYAQANKLGLLSVKKGSRKQQTHDYGPDMDEAIRAAWPELDGKKRGAVNALADRLAVPRWWLSKRARQLGLVWVPHKKEPPWTAAEDALMRRVPLHDPDRAAEIFREHGFSRTPVAIVVRSKRLELSRRATRTTLSAHKAAVIVGFDCSKSLIGYILSGHLKAERRGDRRLPQQGGAAWDIEPAELRRFVLTNLERIDLRKVDKFAFVDLVAGGLDAPAPAMPEIAITRLEPGGGRTTPCEPPAITPAPAATRPVTAPQTEAPMGSTREAGEGVGDRAAPRPPPPRPGVTAFVRIGGRPERRPFRPGREARA